MGNSVATKESSPAAAFSSFMERYKPQLSLVLPKQMNADRMARLAVTAFSKNRRLQECTPTSIAGAVLTAAQLGLEIEVGGHAFLVPYKNWRSKLMEAQLIPGWKGLVDLVSRTGRATVWTGAVFSGDEFDYALGDRPFISHKPGDGTNDPEAMMYVYAVGRVNGSEWPVIEVWTMRKVWAHRDRIISKLPKEQAEKHYSFRDPEMYARKVPLLQVLKYLPSSPEVAAAVAVSDAADRGVGMTLDGDFVTTADDEDDQQTQQEAKPTVPRKSDQPAETAESMVDVSDARVVDAGQDIDGYATGGERQLIVSKIKAAKRDILTVLDEAHITALSDPLTLQGLTKADYVKLKGMFP